MIEFLQSGVNGVKPCALSGKNKINKKVIPGESIIRGLQAYILRQLGRGHYFVCNQET